MKKALVILIAVVFVLGVSGVAFATVQYNGGSTPGADLSKAAGGHTYNPANGASQWVYWDQKDGGTIATNGKTEGAYSAFTASGQARSDDNGTTLDANGYYEGYVDEGETLSTGTGRGPHGDYATTTNKCKTCHGVHRADGIFELLRADDPDSACDYCHVGSGIHSVRAAYYRSTAGKYTSNGHTIGSGPEIPDSSVWQWQEDRTISTASGASITVKARAYKAQENKIFKMGGHGGVKRIGPYLLQCQTCHSVHNGSMLTWKPGSDTDGYMLLRNAPSGSVDSYTAMTQFKSGATLYNAHTGLWDSITHEVTTPETTITASNTGQVGGGTSTGKTGTVYTIWTAWQGPATGTNDGTHLAVWCADCHNLNIGYPIKDLGQGANNNLFGKYSHVDRTHPVPYMQASTLGGANAPDCYSCHVTDMYPGTGTASITGSSCGSGCHISPAGYKIMRGLSDFPHSGDEGSAKLLGDSTGPYVYAVNSTTAAETSTPAVYGKDESGNDITGAYAKNGPIDQICLRCHAEDVGVTQ